jgi:hypothetical protein
MDFLPIIVRWHPSLPSKVGRCGVHNSGRKFDNKQLELDWQNDVNSFKW